MSQSDLDISNITRSLFRAEANAALQALASNSSGATEPDTTYPFQPWADTTSGYMKLRNAANDDWIVLYELASGELAQLGGMNLTGAINEERSAIVATATTTPLWDVGTGNIIDASGTPIITDLPDAPQPGARRVVYFAVGTVLTDNANIDVEGNATYTVEAGDRVEVEALTTSTFKFWIKKKSGIPLVAATFASSSDFNGGTDQTKALNSKIVRENSWVNFTPITANGQTSIDFQTVAAWATEIKLILTDFSTNGTSDGIIQLMDAGGVETTNYAGSVSNNAGTISNFSTGFLLSSGAIAAAGVYQATLILSKIPGTNTWSCKGIMGRSDNTNTNMFSGSKTLSDTLTGVRWTTVIGSQTKDGGTIAAMYR
jgi:hypothetical protein